MGILSQYGIYRDSEGLVQPDPQPQGGISQNSRFTSEMVVACQRHNILDFVRDDLNEIYKKLEQEPGLLQRHPAAHQKMQNGPDDYVAAIAVSKILGNDLALRIYIYGKEHFWVYNNEEPGRFSFSAFLGRQQQIVAHMQFALDEKVSVWRKVWWCIAILSSAWGKRDDQDGKVLAWYLIITQWGHSDMCDLTARYWVRVFKKQYPGGIGEVLEGYFADPNHPSIKYLWGDYGER